MKKFSRRRDTDEETEEHKCVEDFSLNRKSQAYVGE